MVPRTVAIDEAIRAHAVGQLVILGAGPRRRAWRMPELDETTVFEVDHPASQGDKLRRLGELRPTAARVVPVAVDLAREPLGPALDTAGFNPQSGTTWVWEGVVPYLTRVEVRATILTYSPSAPVSTCRRTTTARCAMAAFQSPPEGPTRRTP